MGIEADLRSAVALRNEMAVYLAVSLLDLTIERGDECSVIAENGIVGGKYARAAQDIEALTAAILQRAGMSWNAMAARVDQSRQALHRRLGARGEELFELARMNQLDDDVDIIEAMSEMKKVRGWEQQHEVLSELGISYATRDIIMYLQRLPKAKEILMAPTKVASDLVELRHIPCWWEFEDLE